jgi:4-hydroxy-3-methylbut-2-en-1-yl diphosphate synthase IspG/GcpE
VHAAELVAAWEQGSGRTPVGRGESLLGALGVDAVRRQDLSVGQRDTLLMDLRGRLFGTAVTALATCPACSEKLEVSFDLDDVRARPPGDPTDPVEVEHEGYTVRARPPSIGDLAALDTEMPWPNARERLLERCVLGARRDDRQVAVDELPGVVQARLETRLAEADPQADVQVVLTCPDCGRTWSALFDIVSFLWQELDAWARSVLVEVHDLASVYGWCEADILAMSPYRRSRYLELVRR